MAPVTIGGRIFGVLTALTGVIVLAMPTTVIGIRIYSLAL
jgi:hypothetical protein